MEKFGYALRYAKYAVINIVCKNFNNNIDIVDYDNNVKEHTNSILEKWKSFENTIIQKPSNIDYFYEYQEGDNIKTIYDFDGYYKGKTINNDLESFNFDV